MLLLLPILALAACTDSMFEQWDMVLSGNYTPETVIEFLYKYTAYNDRGELIWESRVSRWYIVSAPFLPFSSCLVLAAQFVLLNLPLMAPTYFLLLFVDSRLQLDKLLDHVFNSGHVAHTKTKVVFQANGIPPCDESMDLIIAGV